MKDLFKKQREIYSVQQLAGWLWRILRQHRLQVGLNALLGCMVVGLDFALIGLTKWAIDIATHRANGSLINAGIAIVGVMIGLTCIHYISRSIRAILGVKAQNSMQIYYFNRLLHSSWYERLQRHSGDMVNRLERDVKDVVDTVTETVPALISVLVRLCGAFVFLYSMDGRLACITIVVVPFFMLLSRLYMKRMRQLTRAVRTTDSNIQSLLQETLQHQTVVQTLGRQKLMSERLYKFQKLLHKQIKTRTSFSAASAATVGVGFMSCYVIAFLWGVFRLYQGAITYGMMTAFIQLVGQIQVPFRDMARFVPIFVNSLTATERLKELESIPLEQEGKNIKNKMSCGIRFSDVDFGYNESEVILHNFTQDFQPGSYTAIVGKTGSGKTTLVRLMLALISPTKGQVTIYNKENQEIANACTRECFNYVPQGNTLLSGTIRENLLMGDPEANEEKMIKVLKLTCADFVFNMPLGLDSRCGEQGSGISEGQAQRIAIARALLREGGILVLDEATSALDVETEQKLWNNIMDYCKGKTIIFITHRTSVISSNTRVIHLTRDM